MKSCPLLIVVLYLMMPVSLQAREHGQVIVNNNTEYAVNVGGTRGPVNEAIIIENLGDKDLINPRISINGRYDWFDLESITAEAIRGCETDQEKAMAVWSFITHNCHYGGCFGDGTLLNPVRLLNITGSNHCGYWAPAVVSLAEQAGLKARVWEIGHHTVPEVWFDGKWHMIDARIGGNFGLLRDNKTIASEADLQADTYYLTRCLFRNPNPDALKIAMYHYTSVDNYVQKGYEERRITPRTMAYRLRPGEKLIRYFREGDIWYDAGGEFRVNPKKRPKWYGRQADSFDEPQAFTHGEFVFKPDFKKYPLSRFASSSYNVAAYGQDGRSPVVHVAEPRSENFSSAARFYLPVNTPWPVIGARMSGRAYAYGETNYDKAAVSVRVGWSAPAWTTEGEGEAEFDVSLDDLLKYGSEAIYSYSPGFWLDSPPDSVPGVDDYTAPNHDRPVAAGLEEFTVTTYVQVAPKSVPALSRGANRVVYTDETPGSHRVKVTHVWTERNDNRPPAAPRRPRSPADGRRTKNLAPTLSWDSSRDGDKTDSIAEYHIFLSLNSKCIWPLSPNFDTPTGSAGTSFKLPGGWLNPKTTYYWKVRARDSRDLWGPWSAVFKFVTS